MRYHTCPCMIFQKKILSNLHKALSMYSYGAAKQSPGDHQSEAGGQAGRRVCARAPPPSKQFCSRHIPLCSRMFSWAMISLLTSSRCFLTQFLKVLGN